MGFKLPSFSFFKEKPGQASPTGPTTKLGLNTTLVMKGLQKMVGDSGQSLPLIGEKPIRQQLKILGGAWAVAVLLTLSPLLWYGVNLYILKQHTGTSTEMQMLSQRIAKGAQQAAQGNQIAFAQLKDADRRFSSHINNLLQGGAGIPASSNAMRPELMEIKALWGKMAKDIGLMAAQEKNLIQLSNNVVGVNSSNNDLLDLTELLAAQLIQSGAGVREVAAARQLGMLTQRIAKNANVLLLTGSDADLDETFLDGKSITIFRNTLVGLKDGSGGMLLNPVKDSIARDMLGDIDQTFKDFSVHVDQMLQNVRPLAAAHDAQRSLFKDGDKMLDLSSKLTESYNNHASSGLLEALLTVIFGSAALLFAVLFAKVLLDDAKRKAAISEQENKRNQEAILRLLNEMGDLAEGDLTVRARVTEDITGAIADSINYAIDELRSLVVGVNKATEQLARESQEAQGTSEHLLQASEKQSREIEETSAAVLQMADSINQVSANAAESAKVAQQSLQAADKGAAAVQNSIAGMNEIRGQIQETAKRIKRLGESSQEISEIVELISDITEQTNILALNAAIQAASAGEAGRGFTVVAEEVQRLAERSGEATKQIGAIVKTIQTDTHDAVAAMEQSTQGVVEGAKLSDAAGQALSEIERVTRSLADLIDTISRATQAQAEAAGKVATNMQDIQDITNQTTDGTKQTAASVGQLTALAAELKGSVAGFKLA
ncbi:methyl-accepting chemotaxis protein [Sulfuricella denitrificans skB26]|uniref:Methyl-accepting chemotaxis protein n=1 Tax=Sulfuricella denitrificans (strain DSM 22764 / NBRC 105220 / skB26) TaxID=1163617 RepID=S6B8T0_SULDS|nr:methyl-accepting chemotaxis protein [Sulfuricella denitrificans]BAN36722.1 methyl-accepting chemotaxis protein [Sulfuricella denitrificans skB26]